MSLYNMTRGMHPLAGHLLREGLDFTVEDVETIPRLRDVMLFPDEIRILTRTGGGNRGSYEEGNQFLQNRKGYIRDWDDSFDSTYAWWAFEWPRDGREHLQKALNAIKEKRPDLLLEDMGQITNDTIERMKSSGA